jgi:penicillin-binding protein 1A
MPKTPFIAPAGIRMVAIDRRSGKRVYGAWPTDEPKPAVIWEAFKPESEPRRTIRKEEAEAQARVAAKADAVRTRQRNDADFLQDQGGIY